MSDAWIEVEPAGAGLARVLSYQAAAIAKGDLQEFQTAPRQVHLVHGGQPILPLKLRAFLDFGAPRLKASLAALAG